MAVNIVTECKSGQEVLAAYQHDRYDIILLDIVMPTPNGLETMQLIRKQHASTPVLVSLSANTYPHQIKEYLDSGFDYFLSKPLEKTVLATFLKKIIGNRAI